VAARKRDSVGLAADVDHRIHRLDAGRHGILDEQQSAPASLSATRSHTKVCLWDYLWSIGRHEQAMRSGVSWKKTTHIRTLLRYFAESEVEVIDSGTSLAEKGGPSISVVMICHRRAVFG
jgi:hypothetical protein